MFLGHEFPTIYEKGWEGLPFTVVTSSGRRPASTGRRCFGQVGEGSTGGTAAPQLFSAGVSPEKKVFFFNDQPTHDENQPKAASEKKHVEC